MFTFFSQGVASRAQDAQNRDNSEENTEELTQFPPYGSNGHISTDEQVMDDNDINNIKQNGMYAKNQHGIVTSGALEISHRGGVDEKQATKMVKAATTAENLDPTATKSKQDVKSMNINNKNDLWMPDELCTNCYACNMEFTVFRRRHHCRLCGQVVCSTCSAYTLDYVNEPSNVSSHITSNSMDDSTASTTATTATTATTTTTTTKKVNIDGKKSASSTVTVRVCKLCHAGVNGNGTEESATSSSTPLSLSSSNHHHHETANNNNNNNSSVMSKSSNHGHTLSLMRSNSNHSLNAVHVHAHVAASSHHSSNTCNVNSHHTTAANHHQVGSSSHRNNNNANSKSDEARNKMGRVAADQLEAMCHSLLRSELGDDLVRMTMMGGADNDDPTTIFMPEKEYTGNSNSDAIYDDWTDTILSLATQCCSTLTPSAEKEMDVRPYCKVKVVPGGSRSDCSYLPGVVFQKHVSHKHMAKEVLRPRFLLLSGGIDYTRSTNENTHRIASLEGISEAEEIFLNIFMGKILYLKPNVVLVGKAVSRRAQELLLQHDIITIQHVKQTTLSRVARQTNGTILHSNDIIHMNSRTISKNSPIGTARCFRLITYRDMDAVKAQPYRRKSAKRSAHMAARLLGESELDGTQAIQSGLAKRGIARTYAIIDGCPKHLGCTVTLRGLPSRPALKKLKRVFLFLTHVAYNLKLETSYLRERCVRLPPNFVLDKSKVFNSSSICVGYGTPPPGRKNARPWNGLMGSDPTKANGSAAATTIGYDAFANTSNPSSSSGSSSAFDHQSILITSVWMTGKTQCCPAEVKGICYYTKQDVSLGQFLRDSCFNLNLKCQNPTCKKTVLEHTLSFIHNDGQVDITVENMDDPLPPAPLNNDGAGTAQQQSNSGSRSKSSDSSKRQMNNNPIATWSYCNNCQKVVTPLVYISRDTQMYSFGKFLEVYFYNNTAELYSAENRCSCPMQTAATLYFGCGRLAARFTYSKVNSYGVYVRRHLPFDVTSHRQDAMRQLGEISTQSASLFVKFSKHVDRVSRETRSLFGSAANKPEHLQTLASELNAISAQVDLAGKVLHEKITAITSLTCQNSGLGSDKEHLDLLLRLPPLARRYLYLLMNGFNDRLSAIGHALVAMKKLSSTSQHYHSRYNHDGMSGLSSDAIPNEARKSLIEDVMEGMRKLRQMQEVYSKYDVGDITFSMSHASFNVASVNPNNTTINNTGNKVSLPNNPRLPRYHTRPSRLDAEYQDFDDEDYDDDELMYGARNRYGRNSNSLNMNSLNLPHNFSSDFNINSNAVRKSLGSRRLGIDDEGNDSMNLLQFDHGRNSDVNNKSSKASSTSTVTPSGAVKSAINRFFNRSAKELDPYILELGEVGEPRLRLEPGVNGVVVPVHDEQPSTIIAHSLASAEYDSQFRDFAMAVDGVGPVDEDHLSGRRSEHSSSKQVGSSSGNIAVDKSLFASPTFAGNLDMNMDVPNASNNGTDSSSTSNNQQQQQPSWAFQERKELERRMLARTKTHIKHSWRDVDAKGEALCKFVCTTYWATQFQAVRQAFMGSSIPPSSRDHVGLPHIGYISPAEVESHYVLSLSRAHAWAASGGKSGASFSRTADGMFVVKCISRTELQMFLDCAPSYFEYLSKSFFHGLPTVLCKIVGVYQIGYHNRVTGKRTMEQVAVMQNMFYGRKITHLFDLKGSLRGRFTHGAQNQPQHGDNSVSGKSPSKRTKKKKSRSFRRGESEGDNYDAENDESDVDSDSFYSSSSAESEDSGDLVEEEHQDQPQQQRVVHEIPSSKEGEVSTFLDGDFLEFTSGHPLPLNDRAKAVFHMSILNDTLFLSIINVLDYSILVGIDSERMELVVGIIDFMRQYDILKQMERVGKSIPMVVGQEAPTIIQPPLYKQRFTNAMERYFMTVPNKWTSI